VTAITVNSVEELMDYLVVGEEVTEVVVKSISQKEFYDFKQWYFSEGNKYQRFGQAFWNQFSEEYNLVEVENLFYEEDNKEAERTILENYVEFQEN
jgi:hypothetical protein